MDELKREFRGVWIAREIWLDKRLNALDKVILAEIDSLDNAETGCFASNEYLKDFAQCSERKVTEAISKLNKFGYIYVQSFNGRTRILRSRLAEFARQSSKKCEADLQNLRHNNKNNNIDYYKRVDTQTAKAPLVDFPQVGNPQEESTYIIKDVEREDSSPLADFCDKFNINIDGYNMRVHDMDFDKLSEAFAQSEWLRQNFISLTKICREYEKIVGGYYKDFTTPQRGGQHTNNERYYTREELNALVTDIDDLDL